MTLLDAQRALGEMVAILDPEHVEEVKEMLDDAAKAAQDDDESTP